MVCQFKLIALSDLYERLVVVPSAPNQAATGPAPAGNPSPSTVVQTTVRVIRDTKVSRHVKTLHLNECQVCGAVLEVPGGRYSEAAHIRPPGRPHNGPDVVDNVLCLCPNHHVLFDRGSICVDANNIVQPLGTPLRIKAVQIINTSNTEYHRTRIYEA